MIARTTRLIDTIAKVVMMVSVVVIIPQIVKIMTTKSAEDISIATFVLFGIIKNSSPEIP